MQLSHTFHYTISMTHKSHNTPSTLCTEFFPSPPLNQSLNSHKSKAKSPCTQNSTEIMAQPVHLSPCTPSTAPSPSPITPTRLPLHSTQRDSHLHISSTLRNHLHQHLAPNSH